MRFNQKKLVVGVSIMATAIFGNPKEWQANASATSVIVNHTRNVKSDEVSYIFYRDYENIELFINDNNKN
ncbi:MAG: hypothetical protein KKF54_02845 [Candidatus Omnitrophica bacterium]|nr:hypothetical protein [Candidatus Omnitrophota bacterium]